MHQESQTPEGSEPSAHPVRPGAPPQAARPGHPDRTRHTDGARALGGPADTRGSGPPDGAEEEGRSRAIEGLRPRAHPNRKGQNRLAGEASPYLLQHADNPVDWYPWGPEAFARAKAEDKPVFVSIGYSTCHWCHVMARESFRDPEIAALLNEHFVSIKVDREERPDVDAHYMAAVLALTGRGGWPLSVFATPDGKPFYGGTYFPPEDQRGMTGLKTLLPAIAKLWHTRRSDLLLAASELDRTLRAQRTHPQSQELGEEAIDRAVAGYTRAYDPHHGGFGLAPKFPRFHALSFLLRVFRRTGQPELLDMVTRTLEAMARGGVYDQVGGGFHRYSTDERWLVPHFEKMLYDQALAARAYLEAYQVTRRARLAEVARETLDFLLRELRDPRGGFHSALDAESRGQEGRFYLWSLPEILEVLGEDDGRFAAQVFGASEEGNYRDEVTGRRTGLNVLHRPLEIEQLARTRGIPPDGLRERLRHIRSRLLEARARRPAPQVDDKVLADWNGLAIGGLALGARVLGEARYGQAAREAAAFLLETFQDQGRVCHWYRAGRCASEAFSTDHAYLAWGLLDLYEATFEPRWLAAARDLVLDMVETFWDHERGGLLSAEPDPNGILAPKQDAYDGAIPSANSVAALVLARLARISADFELEDRARAILGRFQQEVLAGPTGYPALLSALDFLLDVPRQLVLTGLRDHEVLQALRRVVHERFLPNLVLLGVQPDTLDAMAGIAAWLADLNLDPGRPAAYLCEAHTCHLPTQDPEELADWLDGGTRGPDGARVVAESPSEGPSGGGG